MEKQCANALGKSMRVATSERTAVTGEIVHAAPVRDRYEVKLKGESGYVWGPFYVSKLPD